MLIIIVTLSICLIGFLSFREGMRSRFRRKTSTAKLLKKAESLLALKQWEPAEKILRLLYENGMQGKTLTLLFAKLYRETHRLEEAERWILFGIRKEPQDLTLRLEEGKVFLGLKQWEKAAVAFKASCSHFRIEEDYCNYATALFHLGRFEEAWLLLAPLIETSSDPEFFSLAADTLFQLKNYTEAIKLYHLAIQKGDKSHHLILQLGMAYKKSGAREEAEALFNQLLTKDSDDLEAILGLGACLQERACYGKALEIYQSCASWENKDPALMYQSGICALHTKQFPFAQICFQQILKQAPPSLEVLLSLGICLESQEKWEEAEEIYLKIIQIFPLDPHGYLLIAWLFGVGYTRTLPVTQGIEYAYKALELRPDLISWDILSAALARAGDFEQAFQIQEYLFATSQRKAEKSHRQALMRQLRSKAPLTDQHLLRHQVA